MTRIAVLLCCIGCTLDYSELAARGPGDAGDGPTTVPITAPGTGSMTGGDGSSTDSAGPVEQRTQDGGVEDLAGGTGGVRADGATGTEDRPATSDASSPMGGEGGGSGSGGGGIRGNGGGNGGTGGSAGGTTGSAGASAGTGSTGGAGRAESGGAGGDAGRSGSAGAGGGVGCIPSKEVCDGLDNNCNGSKDESPACPSGCTGFALAGHGYMYCSTLGDVASAKLRCDQQGMHLAWIESAVENAALSSAVVTVANRPYNGGNQAGPFIGGTDAATEGTWLWGNGTSFWVGGLKGGPVGSAYSNWAHDEPNDNATGGEDCIEFLLENGTIGLQGQWNDVPCTSNPIYETLCERY